MIRSIEIKNLRGIREGKLEDLSPLTVLVGPNGSGKSTVLDALLIGASPVPGEAIGRVVRRRTSSAEGARWLFWRGGGFGEIQIVVGFADGRLVTSEISVELPPEGQQSRLVCRRLVGKPPEDTELGDVWVKFRAGNAYEYERVALTANGAPQIKLIDLHMAELGSPLHELLTETVRLGRKRDARAIIGEVVPGVVDLEILTEESRPVLYLTFEDHAVPVALAGGGVQSLVRTSLELASLPGGTALLEEPEVYQHPRAIRQTARAIWAAVRRDVQVILSTHSLELIDALIAEAKDDQELGRLSVYRVQLQDGILKSHRDSGTEAAMARATIEDDLR